MGAGNTSDLNPLKPIVDVGRAVTGFIPGLRGHAAGGVFEVAGASLDVEAERDNLRQVGMRVSRLREAASYSKAARRKLEKMENHTENVFYRYAALAVAAMGGAYAGGIAGSFLIPIPIVGSLVGGFVGGLAAGYAGNKVYSSLFGAEQDQDAVALAAEGYKKRQAGKMLSKEEGFATLMATLSPGKQEKYEERLKDLCGTTDFFQATQSKEGLQALRKMMRDGATTGMLAGYMPLPVNPLNPGQDVVERYTELVNLGVLDARDIILHPDQLNAKAQRFYHQQAIAHNIPMSGDQQVSVPQNLPALDVAAGKQI